jgi:hypothetical protein
MILFYYLVKHQFSHRTTGETTKNNELIKLSFFEVKKTKKREPKGSQIGVQKELLVDRLTELLG